jgi:hypothetical protein
MKRDILTGFANPDGSGQGNWHASSHGGHATAARRRGEEWIMCNSCGSHGRVRRYQAAPLQVSDDVPEFWYLVATAVLAAPIVWTVIFAFALFAMPGAAR